jgi:methylated-DNA-[protein]-cysteine S-methyltransferase
MGTMNFVVFPSELGWMAAAAQGEVLHRLTFGHSSPANAVKSLSFGEIDDTPTKFLLSLQRRLQAFAREPSDDFQDIELAIDSYTDFQRAVVQHCRAISIGNRMSYGELAKAAGYPGAARAVGQVMASNRFPLIVPCHRVVGAKGSLGGFSAPDGLGLKRRLLSAEAGCCV